MIALTSTLIAQLGRALATGDLSELSKVLFPFATTVVAGASRTLDHTEDGIHFLMTAAATFTLPGVKEGVKYKFTSNVDGNMTFTGSANILADGVLAATTVAFSTSSHKIGSVCVFECINVNGTLKWCFTNLGGTAATIT